MSRTSGSRLCPLCGERKISGNKDRCLFCADRIVLAERAAEFRKEIVPMDTCTHIIVKHKEADMEDLYRANGMLCASRQKDIVRFGTDISTAQNRPFLNASLASSFLRVMADVDLLAQERMLPIHEVIDVYPTITEFKAVIDERDMADEHSGLVLPHARRVI